MTSTDRCGPREALLNVQVIGSGPRQVVLLHGFAASRRSWDDLMPYLSTQPLTLHLVDLAGHGGSLHRTGRDYSLHTQAGLVADYLQSRRLRDVTVIGHSMGAAVALLCALDCVAISRLVLIGCPAYPQPLPRFMALLAVPLVGPLLMTLLPAAVIARRGLGAAFHRPERITGQLVARYAAGYGSFAAARALAATVRQLVPPDHRELVRRYRQLTIPVLLLWGEHDHIVRPWQGERLREEIPGACFETIADCGHNPQEELPGETWRRIAGFLGSRSGIDKDGESC